jgi:hypothetical protein
MMMENTRTSVDWSEIGVEVRSGTTDVLVIIGLLQDEFWKKWGHGPDTLVIGSEFLRDVLETLKQRNGPSRFPWPEPVEVLSRVDDIEWEKITLYGLRIKPVDGYYKIAVEGQLNKPEDASALRQGDTTQTEIVTLAVTTAATVQMLEQRIHELEEMFGPVHVMSSGPSDPPPPVAPEPRRSPRPRSMADEFSSWIQQAPPEMIREKGL